MITEQDLRWWLEIAPTLEWIFAKTYADTAPHEYSVLDRCTLSREDCVRAAKVIHTFGEPGKFYSSTNIYLGDGQWKWWTMDAVLDDTNLINRATIERVYGRQDAPCTRSGHFSVYDAIATEYDDIAGSSREVRSQVQKAITGHFTDRPPRTLDVGCGTGALLDMTITTPDLYTGIDPSQGMLNALVRKHPDVKDLRPCRVQDVLSKLEPGSFDLVTALFGSASYLAPAVIEHLWRVAGRMMVLMHFDEMPAYLDAMQVHLDAMLIPHGGSRAAPRVLGGRVEVLGGYRLTIIEKGDN